MNAAHPSVRWRNHLSDRVTRVSEKVSNDIHSSVFQEEEPWFQTQMYCQCTAHNEPTLLSVGKLILRLVVGRVFKVPSFFMIVIVFPLKKF